MLVDKNITDFKNVGIYAIALDDALHVKRLQILPGKKLKVKSDNLNYNPFKVSLETDNFHIVSKVVWADDY
ncbi:MAG: helix-turn-helix transcriptional regulator [Candidatus Gastranaerophilales bacterium]|nr:helix-turn-helix transcriptional regulator [Candidatus Gastranaerophilales bacterium]